MVLRGQRLPSRDMIEAFEKDFNFTPKEKQYFELLVKIEKAEAKNQDTEIYRKKLQELAGISEAAALGLKEFSSISEWYFLAIKQLTSLEQFIEDPEWIRKKLRKKVTPSQVRYALDTMLELGILKRNEIGKIVNGDQSTFTPNDIPSSAIKKHHRGMMEQAVLALEELPVEQRQISSLTLKFKKERAEEAKQELYKFLQEFNQKYYADEGDSVHQLNLQFFDLTNKHEPQAPETRH